MPPRPQPGVLAVTPEEAPPLNNQELFGDAAEEARAQLLAKKKKDNELAAAHEYYKKVAM